MKLIEKMIVAGGDNARQAMIIRQSSLQRAVETIVANNGNADGKVLKTDVTELADYFANWVVGDHIKRNE